MSPLLSFDNQQDSAFINSVFASKSARRIFTRHVLSANFQNLFVSQLYRWMALTFIATVKTSFWSNLLASCASILTYSIRCILKVGSQAKMIWIAARRVVAFVQDTQLAGVNAKIQEVSNSVRSNRKGHLLRLPCPVIFKVSSAVPLYK